MTTHSSWPQAFSPRIINGDAVAEESFKGVVAITYKGNTLCSGSLVTPTKIITAAHCILPIEVPGKFKDFISEAGVYIGSGLDGGQLPSQYKIKNYWVHPEYRNHPFGKNDLAVIELVREIKNVKPIIILDSIELFKKNLKTESEVIIMGYGYRQNTINEYPAQVKTLVGKKYKTKMIVKSLNANEIYLEANETGPCSGDSGGPAFVKINEKSFLVGVASRVTGQCGNISTGVFYGVIADSACWLAGHGIILSSFKQVCNKDNTLTRYAVKRVIGHKSEREVKELDLSNQYINSLAGISKFKNLEVLNITGNKVSSLKLLLGLTKLREIYIAGNNISVEDLESFKKIVIGKNKQLHNHYKTKFFLACESISKTTNDNKLIVNEILSYTQSADCFNAHITLQSLSILDLSGLGLKSIDLLKGYDKFNLLYLDDNNLESISVLKDMSLLETLYFSHNQVEDLSPLLKLNKLQYVDASYNDIKSVHSLKALDYFLMINLSGNSSLDKKSCFENQKLRCL
mgnify:CR=1 FL=1